MFTLLEWLIAVLTIFIVIYYLMTRKFNFFKDRGVNYIKPLPIVGNMLDVLRSKRNLPEILQSLYDKFPNSSYFGFFEFITPIYVIRDPEIIKKITLSDFDHFVNHRMSLDRDNEPIFSRFLFFSRSNIWKDMRSTMSPAFTGSKMRKMFIFINEYVEHLCSNMIDRTNKEIELKDFYSRIGSDVNATCAFGLNVDSFKDENNQFFTEVSRATDFRGFQALKFFLTVSFPEIIKFLKIRILNKSTLIYLRKIVGETVKYRQDNNIIRQDMIHLVMEAIKGNLKHSDSDMKYDDAGFATVSESEYGRSLPSKMEWENDDCVAQCFQFLIAGFDTTSAILSFTTHELAINPDVQEKLFQEIDEVKENLNGEPMSYEKLNKMKYLDMVVSEGFRKWPPITGTDRICNKDFLMESKDGTNVVIKSGEGVFIPIYNIHRDPENYPNPSKFDPERFSDENKDFIKQCSYMPFGLGPRNCIGSRFALMQIKTVLFNLLSKFSIETSENTQNPIKLKKNNVGALYPEIGVFVKLKLRKQL